MMKEQFDLLNEELWKSFGFVFEKDTKNSWFLFDKEVGYAMGDNIGYLVLKDHEFDLISNGGIKSFPISDLLIQLDAFLYNYFFS